MNKNLITGKMLRNKKGKRECNLWWLVVLAGGIEASFKNVKSLISIVFPVFYSTSECRVRQSCTDRTWSSAVIFLPPLFIPAHSTRTVLYSFDSGWWMMGALGSLHWNGRLENKNKKKRREEKEMNLPCATLSIERLPTPGKQDTSAAYTYLSEQHTQNRIERCCCCHWPSRSRKRCRYYIIRSY